MEHKILTHERLKKRTLFIWIKLSQHANFRVKTVFRATKQHLNDSYTVKSRILICLQLYGEKLDTYLLTVIR